MMTMNRKVGRLRRASRTRARMALQIDMARLTVHRTPKHIYAQVISRDRAGNSKVLTSASTLDKEVRGLLKGNKMEQATLIGKIIGQRAVKVGIKRVAFDRSGFKYHGRVKVLAESARASGLDF